jgi:hypothetical protein
MLSKTGWPVLLLLLSSMTAPSQTTADHEDCSVLAFSSTQEVTLRGKIGNGPHDMLLIVPHCDNAVVLVYAGDSDTDVPVARFSVDRNLKRFRKYTEATYKHFGGGICMQCPKYDVRANLTGQLEVATTPDGLRRDNTGFLWDTSGKLRGTSGFGHPNRSYKYRLVIESVSEVVARKLPKPSQQ